MKLVQLPKVQENHPLITIYQQANETRSEPTAGKSDCLFPTAKGDIHQSQITLHSRKFLVKFASALNDEQEGERTSFFSNSNTAFPTRRCCIQKKRGADESLGSFLGRKLGLPLEAARALFFGANFF